MNTQLTKKVDATTTHLERRSKRLVKKHKTLTIFLTITTMAFLVSYMTLKGLLVLNDWYDTHRIVSHTPIVITLHAPFTIEARSKKEDTIVSPLPKTTPTITPTPRVKKVSAIQKFLTIPASQVREMVLSRLAAHYDQDNVIAFDNILKQEAGYRPDAINEVGACGLAQALPCAKMPCGLTYSDQDIMCQLDWMETYIAQRYGTPSEAWNHELATQWY